jgi:ATP-binding cassette subfamily B protein
MKANRQELIAQNGRYTAFWNERRRVHGWRPVQEAAG